MSIPSNPSNNSQPNGQSSPSKEKNHIDDAKYDPVQVSIEISIDNVSDIHHHLAAVKSSSTISNQSIVITDVPYHKAVPNKWRGSCKKHFEQFWKEYFYLLFDDDLDIQYKNKFAELKIDDIRCIPFLEEKHLLNHVHMLKSDAQRAFQKIQRFNQNKNLFFEWVSNKCQCQKYTQNFENAGILTWEIFAHAIVSKSDLNSIIPENQMNNNIDRKVLWKNVPNDLWDYYNVDRVDSMTKQFSLRTIFPSAINLKPELSWNRDRATPHKNIEQLCILFLILLFLSDVVIAVMIIQRSNGFIEDTVPFLINNILNPLHFIVQLLLILSWMEWLVFGKIQCIQWIIQLLLFVITLLLFFNIIIYVLYFVYGTHARDNFIKDISKVESNKWCRNTWFVLNGIAFIIILLLIGYVSMRRIYREDIQGLALRKEGENEIVIKYEEDERCCNVLRAYLSLSIVRYLILIMFINVLMFVQSGVWLYWRYIQVPFIDHHQIRHKYEFKIIIFACDILSVIFGVLVIFYLRKQRRNYEEIKEMNHSKRRFNAQSKFTSDDLHGFDGIYFDTGSPML